MTAFAPLAPDAAAGVTQIGSRRGADLGPGQPDLRLLPLDLVARHFAEALRTYGPTALAYGANGGPQPARAAFAARSSAVEAGAFSAANVLVTAGASQALDLLCTELARPGDCVLVQRTTYNLALDLFRGRGLKVVGVGRDPAAPSAGEVVEAVEAVRARADRVAFAYLIPTFHNPTSETWTVARRRAVLEAARHLDLVVIEDDPYRELFFASPPAPSLAAMAGGDGVIGIRTVSKVLAPGLRVGWLLARPDLVERLAANPMFASGGGIAHIPALAAAALVQSGALSAHVAELRRAYRARRDALLEGLERARDTGASWRAPDGGFFVWVRLARGDVGEVERLAARHGVWLMDGRKCAADSTFDGRRYMRLAFSMNAPATLRSAGAVLARAISLANWRAH